MGSFQETKIDPLTGSKADSDHVHFSVFSDSVLVLSRPLPRVAYSRVG